MAGVPSNNKCERCKEKHLKCDETRPKCRRCISAKVECPGYKQTRKFIDQSAMLKRRFAPYQGANSKIASDPTTKTSVTTSATPRDTRSLVLSSVGDTSSAERAENHQVSVDHPQRSSPLHTGSGETSALFEHETEAIRFRETQLSGPHTSQLPENGAFNPIPGNSGSRIESIVVCNNNPSPSNESLGNIFSSSSGGGIELPGSADDLSLLSSGRLTLGNYSGQADQMLSELGIESERQNSIFIKRYTSTIGTWLDLSDTDRFYSGHVPLRAIDNFALKYSIAAITSKHIERTTRPRGSFTDVPNTEHTNSDFGIQTAQIDWLLQGTTYYHMAVSEISRVTGGTISTPHLNGNSFFEGFRQWMETIHTLGDDSILRTVENLLASLVLLTLYELMDANIDEWPRHLYGISSLFQHLLALNDRAENIIFPQGIRASFWILARQDFASAYFSRANTQLATESHRLWQAAGIAIDNDNKFQILPPREISIGKEDQAACGILWLVFRITNFLSSVKRTQLEKWNEPSVTGLPDSRARASSSHKQAISPETWLQLCFDLQSWLEKMPETIRPSARVEPVGASDALHLSPFPDIFYALPTSAAAMQLYHFGRIALLLNQPNDAINSLSVSFDRLQGYREVTKEVDYHCRELCGVALGSAYPGVRLPMIPLLYAVGNCLVRAREREVLLALLQCVDSELGWASDYAIRPLQRIWLSDTKSYM